MSEIKKHKEQKATEADQSYFDGLTDKIMERIEIEESILFKDERLKIHPFKTPEGYFDTLAENILNKRAPKTKVIPLFDQRWFRYAAALILLAIASFALIKPFDSKNPEEYLSDISETVIIDYVASESGAMEELFINEEVMEAVLDEMMADIAYKYEDLIDFEKEGFYLDNY